MTNWMENNMALTVEQPEGPGSIRLLLFGEGHGMGWPAAE